ncbi:hypothetical protein Tco_0919589 [Tanacetum coccineum]
MGKGSVNDIHVGEWNEVLDACPKRTGAGWKNIYTQMRQRIDDVNKTTEELELDHSRPLEEQDLIIIFNPLAKRKRKSVSELHDYFKSTKRYKQSVQYNDHPTAPVLNEPTLGMILLNAQHK